MNSKELAHAVVDKMIEHDAFSRWLGIKRLSTEPGRSSLSITIRKEMLNGFGTVHGGVSFSLADSALAFAANSHGRHSVLLESSMSFTKPSHEGDILTAIAEEVHISNRIGIYQVVVKNQKQETVGLFKGTVFRTSKEWEL